MSQPTNFGMQSGPPAPPTAVAIRLNESLDALLTSNSGSTAPSYAQAGTCWIDTSGTPWEWKIYDGTSWLVIGEVNASTHTLTLSTDVSIEIGDVDGLTAALAAKADETIEITGGGLATGGGSLAANRTITVTVASQVQAEAGTATNVAMTPQRTAQAIAALGAPSSVGQHTISVPAGAMIARTTNGAASATAERTNNRVMERGFDFDASSDEFVQFVVPMPKSWNEGTVTAQFIWTAHSSSGNVVWGIQGLARGDGDGIDTAFGTAQTVTDGLLSTGAAHISAATSAITIGGSPAEGDMVWFQVYRDADSGSDTLGADARLLAVRLIYTTNAATDA